MLRCKGEKEALVMFCVHKKECQALHFHIMPNMDSSGFLRNGQQTYIPIKA